MHGVTHTLDEIRDRGVPGFEVEVIGTDANVDRRLPAVAEVEIPYYAGLQVGVPSLPAIVDALADGRYDLVHVCSPGPSGARRAAAGPGDGAAGGRQLPHRAGAYAGLRSGCRTSRLMTGMALAAFYGACEIVLSPSPASDAAARRARRSRPDGSAAGTAASTSALRPAQRIDDLFQARSTCSTPGG